MTVCWGRVFDIVCMQCTHCIYVFLQVTTPEHLSQEFSGSAFNPESALGHSRISCVYQCDSVEQRDLVTQRKKQGGDQGTREHMGRGNGCPGLPSLGGCLVKCSSQEGTQDLGNLARVWEEGHIGRVLCLLSTRRKEEAGPLLLAQDKGLQTFYKQEELAQQAGLPTTFHLS